MPRLPVSERLANRLNDIVKQMGGGAVEIGFAEGDTYDDGTPVAAVAFWNEFGHGGHFPSPPRPFFRNMITAESPGWPAKMAALAKAYNYDGAKVLDAMGGDIQGALKESIENFQGAPLSPTTLVLRSWFWSNPEEITINDVLEAQKAAAAGFNRATGGQAHPLEWTKNMLNKVTYRLVK